MIHEFGFFTLDARERALRLNGKPVSLTPKVFDILLVLVQKSGRVVTKQELMELVWPDAAVEESNLARHVSRLRTALGDAGKNRYIATVPWRGYRFVADVRHVLDEPQVIDSLAVLPFLNESADPAGDYLSEGMTESIINRLSLIADLKVMSRNSVFRYKVRERGGPFQDARIVGKELTVRAVLTGRIRQVHKGLVVSVELIDAIDNRQLWGAQYTQGSADVFALQETISSEIVERLHIRLSSDDKRQLEKRETENSEAYRLYLKGRFFMNKMTLDGLTKGLELFRQAITEDPEYALAYSGFVDCHMALGNPVEARKSAAKALRLDPSLGEVHASLGFLTFLYDWNWRKAEAKLRKGIELSPNYAQARQWYALYLAKMGRHKEAAQQAQQAQQLDPLSLSMNVTKGLVLCFARQYDQAIDELRKVVEMDANFAAGHSALGLAYSYRKMCDEAIAAFNKAAALTDVSDAEWSFKALIACCYATCGRSKQAKSFLRAVEDLPTGSPYVLGTIYAQLGERTRALDFLERACRERNAQVVWMKVDPALDPLRSTRRFKSLLARVGLA